ncbi:MAG: universal stress protein [Verrucomicrobia bacterium]|nr:universal stress protein [Verrucomicrobiota bacterium]
MNRLKSVLVGVDFSECSTAALHQAARLAQWNKATLHVLHVVDAPAVAGLAKAMKMDVEQQREMAQTAARRELSRCLGRHTLPDGWQSEAVVGAPLDTILDRAREVKADLIVLGERGSNTASPQVGLVALRVLRRSPVKVLLVDSDTTAPFQRVIACVDFAPSCREVIEQARRLAALNACRVDFLHIYDPPWDRLRYVLPALSLSEELRQQYLNMLDSQLADFVGSLSGLDARLVLRESPRYQSGIALHAQLENADLILLATNARRTPGDELLGSTAERLVRELPCSVLVVKPSPPANAPNG